MQTKAVETATDTAVKLAHLSQEVSKAKAIVNDVIEDGKREALRTVKRAYVAAEDRLEDTTYYIKRHPWQSVGIAAGVSAAVEPKARAYRDAKQLSALVSGAVGAAQYEILSNQQGLAVTSVTAQSAAQIVLILAIVAGNIAFWISRARDKD